MKPRHDKVILKVLKEKKDLKQTEGGIYIPHTEASEDAFLKATVEEVGPKVENLKKGDEVRVHKNYIKGYAVLDIKENLYVIADGQIDIVL